MVNVFKRPGRFAYEVDRELVDGFTDDRTRWPEGLQLVAEVLYTLDRQLSPDRFRRVLDAVASPAALEELVSCEERIACAMLTAAVPELHEQVLCELVCCAGDVDEDRREAAAA